MAGGTFECRTCGKPHEGPPPSLGFAEPDPCRAVPEAERAARVLINADTCIIDDARFFVLGLIEIPVLGEEDLFVWMVWLSIDRECFDRATEVWEDPDRVFEPPCSGRLSNRIPGYPDTRDLVCRIHTQDVGVRPLVVLEPADHPLVEDQRRGMTRERLSAILHGAMAGTS